MRARKTDVLYQTRMALWNTAISDTALKIFFDNLTGKSALPYIRAVWEQTAHDILKLSSNYNCNHSCFLKMSEERRNLLIIRQWRVPAFQLAIYRQFKII